MMHALVAGNDLLQLAAGNPPDVNPTQPPGMGGVSKVLNWVAWGVTVLCVAGLLIVGGKLAMAHRQGEGYEAGGGVAKVLAAALLVGAASGLVGALMTK